MKSSLSFLLLLAAGHGHAAVVPTVTTHLPPHHKDFNNEDSQPPEDAEALPPRAEDGAEVAPGMQVDWGSAFGKIDSDGDARLSWYSTLFQEEEIFAKFRKETEFTRELFGDQVFTGANYSPHHLALCYGHGRCMF